MDGERAKSAGIGDARAMISLAEGDPAAALAAVRCARGLRLLAAELDAI